ncbi:FecR family protein [Pseudomonas delhiensis]|uniref:FecR family protein n=1 Tax=Pseudomonas delhiensis TaxID=366289 RepID=A0A239L6G1_9PSED|nr:FecR family protein [Pseudomonas delhiensis]SDK59161.1 FecR family protein [Pseudomonas delhiensis]SNT26177.1 FecR family protein [Pseudomonas delhiensis]
MSRIDLENQALDWLVELHSGRVEAGRRREFAQWRAQSPAHESAARSAEALWGALPATRAARRHRLLRPRRLAVVAAAACVAALAVAVALPTPVAGIYADYATRTGERRLVELADGSRVWLNSASALSVDFSASRRSLHLYGGEALFEVARDAQRPFVVHAGDGEVTAVGTRFDVDSRGPGVQVAVTEGVVRVEAGGQPAVRLAAGERLAYQAAPGPVQPLDLDSASAWQRGKLIFNQRPLGEVLAELERYLPGRILLTDEVLRRHKVSGVFDLDDPDALLQTLQRLQPVRVTRLPWLVVVRPVSS